MPEPIPTPNATNAEAIADLTTQHTARMQAKITRENLQAGPQATLSPLEMREEIAATVTHSYTLGFQNGTAQAIARILAAAGHPTPL